MSHRGRAVLSALGVVLLFSLPLLPEILGKRRLIFRDAQATHWPWRRVAMASLRTGNVPFVNGSASGGEPLLANPNSGLLYPTLLLETLLPPASAFNLHYLVHVLWAFFGARALGRRLGLSGDAAFVAGVSFAFSGMMLSYGSAFMNAGAAAAWLPWCAAAAVDLVRAEAARRAAAAAGALGLAFGLQLLAGEPALSLLTAVFSAFLAAGEIFSRRQSQRVRWMRLGAGGAFAVLVAAAFASPLLLTLSKVLPLTYRGQHLYSERAFGASSFSLWRGVEWLFPRFGGDPGSLGPGGHWQYALHREEIIYIWCVTFGVVPLLLVLLAGLRRRFWKGLPLWLAAGGALSLLFAAGTSLPFSRFLFSFDTLRRFRYPIKFYLVTTACVALLAGFAVERSRGEGPMRREKAAIAVVLLLFALAFWIASPGGLLDRWVEPLLEGRTGNTAEWLREIRRVFRGDALLGALGIAVVSFVLLFRRRLRRGYLLGFATLLLALPWGLPLFVTGDQTSLSRPPALLSALRRGAPAGRLYVSPALSELDVLASGVHAKEPEPRLSKLARVQIELLVPATGAPFGVEYAFDDDPDGSYGYYNRLAEEALLASTPAERGRLLRTYGARWILAEEGEHYPLTRPVTGFSIEGRRLILHEMTDPLPEIRFAGREHRRRSLSGALDLVRSQRFRPSTDVVLPGRSDRDAPDEAGEANVRIELLQPGRGAARVEATRAGHLLFSRTYFPAWKASLDGRNVPVLVANARDLAVRVPAGSHRIEFRYEEGPFQTAVLLQAGALLIVCVAACLAVIRSR